MIKFLITPGGVSKHIFIEMTVGSQIHQHEIHVTGRLDPSVHSRIGRQHACGSTVLYLARDLD